MKKDESLCFLKVVLNPLLHMNPSHKPYHLMREGYHNEQDTMYCRHLLLVLYGVYIESKGDIYEHADGCMVGRNEERSKEKRLTRHPFMMRRGWPMMRMMMIMWLGCRHHIMLWGRHGHSSILHHLWIHTSVCCSGKIRYDTHTYINPSIQSLSSPSPFRHIDLPLWIVSHSMHAGTSARRKRFHHR